jgi:hypothetical protein
MAAVEARQLAPCRGREHPRHCEGATGIRHDGANSFWTIAMNKQDEFDLLAAAFRQFTEFCRLHQGDDAWERKSTAMFAEAYEAAIAKHDMRVLRANFGELCADVESVWWGPDYLREFQKRQGVSLQDVRGTKSPQRRLERILSRGTIETPAELRIAQDRLESGADDREGRVLTRLVVEYYESHPKD